VTFKGNGMGTESQAEQGSREGNLNRDTESQPPASEDFASGFLSGDRPFFRMAILLFLVGFLYVIHQELSPFLIGLLLLAILVMVRKGVRFEAGVAVVVVLLFGAWLMGDMAGLFWPFVTSFVLAYLLSPLVGLMERWMSRTIAIALMVVVILGVLSGIGIVVVPLVTHELLDFGRQVPSYTAMLKDLYDRFLLWLQTLGMTLPKGQLLLEQLPQLGELFAEQTIAALKGLSSGLATLLNFLMIPFVTFYMIKDYERIKQTLARILPRRHAASAGELLSRVDEVLGQYLRGQMLVSSFVALLTSAGLLVFGIRYAVLLGLMAGLFNLIPYIGMAVAFSVACLVAILDVDPAGNLVKVVGIFAVVQGIEGNFLSPRVVGQRVGLHPVWVMFALVVGAHFWGFIGMLIAIPAAAVVNILWKVVAERYYNSLYYKSE
jgi:predicted PurR-regulated permease PerM